MEWMMDSQNHDSLEEGVISEENLRLLLFDIFDRNLEYSAFFRESCVNQIVRDIKTLTKKKGQSYEDYLADIKTSSQSVIRVKICDMLSNLTAEPTEKQRKKYKVALEILRS